MRIDHATKPIRRFVPAALAVAALAAAPAHAGVGQGRLSLELAAGDACTGTGTTLEIEVTMSDVVDFEASGFQAFIVFDDDALTFLDGDYTLEPFGIQPMPTITATNGRIQLAAGINQFSAPPQTPTSEDAVLATLRFETAAEACATLVEFDPTSTSSLTSTFGLPPGTMLLDDAPPITVDETAPSATCAPDAMLGCASAVPAPDPDTVVVDEACGPLTIMHLGDVESGGTGCGADPLVITRTYEVTDACGNVVTCTRVFTVADTSTTAPTFDQAPGALDATVECGDDLDPAALGAPTATDNCGPASDLAFEDDLSGLTGCGGSGAIVRTWTATDACGNGATYVQTITVVDTTPPVLQGVPADATVSCDAIPAPAVVTGADVCDPGPITATVGETETPAGCGGERVITRTWTATDACGNSATAQQQITVVDTTPPVLVVPADAVVECGGSLAPAQTGEATATDACGSNATVTFDDDVDFAGGSCSGEAIVTRTWTAVDACGNETSATQTIAVQDTTPPAFADAPGALDVAVDCAASIDPASTGTPTASDGCAVAPTVTWNDAVSGTCPVVVVRVWTATDGCGNESTYLQTITREDTTPPAFVEAPGALDVTIECGASDQPEATGTPTVTDECGVDPALAFTDAVAAGPCAGTSIITRTWTATDSCGNEATYVQTITALDTGAPAFADAPGALDATIECGDADDAPAPVPTDACDPAPTATSSDAVTAGPCAGTSTIVRTWTVVDACGNAGAPYVQTITVVDTTPPVFGAAPGALDVVLECGASTSPVDTGVPTVSDDCGSVALDFADETSGACPETITRTWTAIDACGNEATYVQTITLEDTVAPILVGVPADMEVACGEIPDAEPADVTATDGCDVAPVVTVEDETVPGACKSSSTITRTWTATDACGNVATATQTIVVGDVTGPTLVGVPANTSASCDAIPAAPTVTATDDCDPAPTVALEESITEGDCAGERLLTRTWTATDACGNETSASQVIAVVDLVLPVFDQAPDELDVTVPCGGSTDPADLGTPTATDSCDPAPVVAFTDLPVDGFCPAEGGILRTWTATDACGNVAVYLQTISFADDVAPEIAGVPADVTVSCNEVPDPATPTATDDCDPAPMLELEQSTETICLHGVVITRTWTATDACGNVATATQVVTVADDEPPVFNHDPGALDLTVECDLFVGAPTPLVSDNCDPEPSLVSDDLVMDGACAQEQVIRRTWTATDACGNIASFEQVITLVDTTPPDFAEAPGALDVVIGCLASDDPADVGTPIVADNCDDAFALDYADEIEEAGCPFNRTITRTWTAEDACGNVSTYVQTIESSDVTPPAFADFPDDLMNEQCSADIMLPDPKSLVATDDCDEAPLIEFVGDVTVNSGCGATVTRTYRATDACGNFVERQQTFSFADSIAPVIASTIASAGPGVVLGPEGLLGESEQTFFDDPETGDGALALDADATYSLRLTGIDPAPLVGGTTVEMGIEDTAAGRATSIEALLSFNGVGGHILRSLEGTTLRTDQVLEPGTATGRFDLRIDFHQEKGGAWRVTPLYRGEGQFGWVRFGMPWTSVDTWDFTTARAFIRVTSIAGQIDYARLALACATDESVCPEDVMVNADAGTTAADLGLVAPIVMDNCSDTPTLTVTRSDFRSLDEPFAAADSPITVTYTGTDACGNTTECVQTVTVGDQNELLVAVELSPTIAVGASPATLTRCITFELHACGDGPPDVIEVPVTFDVVAGQPTRADLTLLVPGGRAYSCITARDRLHTLRRTDADDFGIVDRRWVCDFTNRTAEEGDDDSLVGGNLNDDRFIDVLDFGLFATQFPISFGSGDTDCATEGPHADVSGDGIVFIEDVGFISANFLRQRDLNCCGLGTSAIAAAAEPTVRISVEELHERGLGELVRADLTGDGWLDDADILAFLGGARPEAPAPPDADEPVYVGKAGGDWHDARQWKGVVPGPRDRAIVAGSAVVDRGRATVGALTVRGGGDLTLHGGALEAGRLVLEPGAALLLDGTGAIRTGALDAAADTLRWRSGDLELHGGPARVGGDLLIGTAAGRSTLLLADGARGRVAGDLVLAAAGEADALLEVTGLETELGVRGTASIGRRGAGTLLVTRGALLHTGGGALGEQPRALGMAQITGAGSAWIADGALRLGGAGIGEIEVGPGALLGAPELHVAATGVLFGVGDVEGVVVNGGRMETAGGLHVSGELVQAPTGVLRVAPPRRGTAAVTVDGPVVLDGVLELDGLGLADVRPGDEIVVLTATRIDGAFVEHRLPAPARGLRWAVEIDDRSVRLRAVRDAARR